MVYEDVPNALAPTTNCEATDFPSPSETVTLEWQQDSQNFVITDVE